LFFLLSTIVCPPIVVDPQIFVILEREIENSSKKGKVGFPWVFSTKSISASVRRKGLRKFLRRRRAYLIMNCIHEEIIEDKARKKARLVSLGFFLIFLVVDG